MLTQRDSFAAYVALSRATSMDGLQVLNFSPTKYVVAVSLPYSSCSRIEKGSSLGFVP
jgi:hypothetical protein